MKGVKGEQLGIVFERYDKDVNSLLADTRMGQPMGNCFLEDGMSKMLSNFVDSMLDGLNLLHQKGVVHRDFKPQNVLMRGIGKSCTEWQFSISDLGGSVHVPLEESTNPVFTHEEKVTMFEWTKQSPTGHVNPKVGASPEMLPWYSVEAVSYTHLTLPTILRV